MDSDKLQQIQAYARAIAALLYDETAPERLTTLEGIEGAVREHILEDVSPEIGHFLSRRQAGQPADVNEHSKAFSERSTSARTKRKPFKSKNVPN